MEFRPRTLVKLLLGVFVVFGMLTGSMYTVSWFINVVPFVSLVFIDGRIKNIEKFMEME